MEKYMLTRRRAGRKAPPAENNPRGRGLDKYMSPPTALCNLLL